MNPKIKRPSQEELPEKNIQSMILKYLSRRKDIVYWRQNSGSFTAAAIRTVTAILAKFNISIGLRQGIIAAIKKSLGHYTCTSEKGLPDIAVIYRCRYIGLEVKTAKGRQNADQKLMQQKIEKAGGAYYIVRSLDDAMDIFRELDKKLLDKKE